MVREDRRKKASVKRKKRRGFSGVRRQEGPRVLRNEESNMDVNPANSIESPDNSTPICTTNIESISSQKLLNSSFEKLESRKGILTREQARNVGLGSVTDVEAAKGLKIQDAQLLSDCISTAAVCSSCRKATSKLRLYQNNRERNGLAEALFLKCSECQVVTPLLTSQRLGGRGGGSHEVNRRAVMASYHFGHAGLSQFCAVMNLPPPVAPEAYNKHLIQIERASKIQAEEVMNDAAARLHQKVSIERPDAIEEDGEDTIAHVSVTVDGTWQKRGHSSKIGVVFVISVDTGEILDYEVKSLFCHSCQVHSRQNQDSQEYKDWKKAHKEKCEVNHCGSAEDMEASAAVEIFTRSVETRRLKYTTFVGDGDSSCFGRVKEAMEKKYGAAYEVTKEECVGHVQKRLGTALRKYKKDKKGQKLADGKTVGGKGRLTDKIIDSMQNYYGQAIRENKGNLEGMKKSIKAIQHHMIKDTSNTLKKQHQYCPKSSDSWCKYWKDKANGTKLYNDDKRLSDVFMTELNPIFVRLSNDALLQRCLKGLTQNQNEAANGILWSKCPKTRFCGARRVRIAVCQTVASFNTGAGSCALNLDLCGVTPGSYTMRALDKQDKMRLRNAAKKVSDNYKKSRRKRRAQKKEKADKTAYQAGAFDLNVMPVEDVTSKKKKRAPKKPKKRQNTEEPQIRFVMPKFEVVGTKRPKQ